MGTMTTPRQMTPVKAKDGKVVHATSLATPRRTACGKRCDGWIVHIRDYVGCIDCKATMFKRVEPGAVQAGRGPKRKARR